MKISSKKIGLLVFKLLGILNYDFHYQKYKIRRKLDLVSTNFKISGKINKILLLETKENNLKLFHLTPLLDLPQIDR